MNIRSGVLNWQKKNTKKTTENLVFFSEGSIPNTTT